ncbi:surface-adhesin E family protein [Amylibacter sp.]|nr:surface-adhesin E family protein [Amylibacter sp.]MDB9784848.1 surface-adhesin E family protein [Amylibacter sp.]
MIKKTNTSALQILALVVLVLLATPANAKWTKLMSYNNTDYYVELGTIKQGWSIVSYQLLENYVGGNFVGESSVQSIEVDCRTKRHRMVRADYYSRHFGRGRNTDYLTEDWAYPTEGSVADYLDRGVCGYLSSR